MIAKRARCKRDREDEGYWTQIEQLVEAHWRAGFTHGLCPECRSKLIEGSTGKGAEDR